MEVIHLLPNALQRTENIRIALHAHHY